MILKTNQKCVNLTFFLLICLLALTGLTDGHAKKSDRYFEKLSGDEGDSEKKGWESFYMRKKDFAYGKEPSPFLRENLALLPPRGKVLDLGMGEGRNAVFLATQGYEVTGVDFSQKALSHARALSQEKKVKIRIINKDLRFFKIPKKSFDVILNIFYLNKDNIDEIIEGLKENGIVVVEMHVESQKKYEKKRHHRDLLKPGELRHHFQKLKILKYQEIDTGREVVARIIAQNR